MVRYNLWNYYWILHNKLLQHYYTSFFHCDYGEKVCRELCPWYYRRSISKWKFFMHFIEISKQWFWKRFTVVIKFIKLIYSCKSICLWLILTPFFFLKKWPDEDCLEQLKILAINKYFCVSKSTLWNIIHWQHSNLSAVEPLNGCNCDCGKPSERTSG